VTLCLVALWEVGRRDEQGNVSHGDCDAGQSARHYNRSVVAPCGSCGVANLVVVENSVRWCACFESRPGADVKKRIRSTAEARPAQRLPALSCVSPVGFVGIPG